VGRSPDISVMWRTEYYAGAGYIRHVAVKRLKNWRILLKQSFTGWWLGLVVRALVTPMKLVYIVPVLVLRWVTAR